MKTKLWAMLGLLYFPIFLAFWLLTYIVRVALAICYAGQLDFKHAKDIIRTTFSLYSYGYR